MTPKNKHSDNGRPVVLPQGVIEKGGIGKIWGSSASERLQTALERLDWRTVPSPADFRFRMKGLRVSIKIEKGEPALLFYAL